MLEVIGLTVALAGPQGPLEPVVDASFAIGPGETFALVGESGCGKSMTALALTRLLPPGGHIAAGDVRFYGESLADLPEGRMRGLRGPGIGMIFQEPATSLNPVLTIRTQIVESLRLHRALASADAEEEAIRLLRTVGIPDPDGRLAAYPFQLSGGMKQRVMIAMALAPQPKLLIADEPTTALDVTIQAQVLDLLARLQAENRMGMLLITHDLGVVARMADRVGVMYAGQIIETGPRESFFAQPLHPYSRALFGALPRRQGRGAPLLALGGRVPGLEQVPPGCRFADRCPQVMARCHVEAPPWSWRDGGQAVRCHLYSDGQPRPPLAASSIPATGAPDRPPARHPVLDVRALAVHFPVRRGFLQRTVGAVRAVDGVDLEILPGRTLALVGESGCGKTTVGKAILQLVTPTEGEVYFEGDDLTQASAAILRQARRGMQMIFQDPFASLNPRLTIGETLLEGMTALGVAADPAEREVTVAALLERVGLSAGMMARYPHEFSGGQRQRIAIARALAVSPRLVICDEPTSALDVSVQAQILNLMAELQRELGLAYLFITHNLAVVDYLAHDVAVMYLGRIVERGPARAVLDDPRHPYTLALAAAVPRLPGESGPSAVASDPMAVDMPSAAAAPRGCHYQSRCPRATDICRQQYPTLQKAGAGRSVACHWPLPPQP
ncbi:MAG: ABC transporter ATP-binding protein [Zoogloeaceae bacterium]|nr:ABC transporter ATP-binding protein [Zoogloeaceae bacterium]